MPITYKQWEVIKKLCGNRFLWSNELRGFDSKFKNYCDSKSDGAKDIAYQKFNKWHQSKSMKCKKEQEKIKAHCEGIEKTVKITIVKKGIPKYIHQPVAIKGGVYNGYRGLEGKTDYHTPTNIAKVGLELWPQARREGNWMGKWFEKIFKSRKDGASFARNCIAEKDRSRPTIATSLDGGCGGFTGDYIYKFEIPGLKEVVMSKKVLTISKEVPWQLPLKMYIEKGAKDVNASKIVGVNLNVATYEVVFLTKIESQYIKKYCPSGGKEWLDMPVL